MVRPMNQSSPLPKIGITQNLDQRIKDIQAMSPTKLRLIVAMVVKNQEVETFLHRKFDEFRSHGEWFQIPQSKCIFINELGKKCVELIEQPDCEKSKLYHEQEEKLSIATSWDDFCDFILAVGDSEIRDTEQANENQRTTPSTN